MNKHILAGIYCLLSISALSGQSYQNAESVEYDPVNNQWLVSNGGNIIADDGAGNLTNFGTVALSYGLEVIGDHLFGIQGSTIRVVNLNTESQVTSIIIPNAGFLNGMTTDGNSNVYVTDFSNRKIFRIDAADLDNLSFEEIVSNTGSTPNGIVYDAVNNRLLYVNWGSNAAIKAVDLSDNSVSTIITTSLTNIDGIDEDNNGNYYLSSWSPSQISKYDADFANPLEVVTTPFINNPADICYTRQNDILGIPVGNNVVFVDLSEAVRTTNLLDANELNFNIYPNPASVQSYIQFELSEQAPVQVDLLSMHGQVLRNLLKGIQAPSTHKVLFAGHDLPSGSYLVRLQIGDKELTERVVLY